MESKIGQNNTETRGKKTVEISADSALSSSGP